LGPAPPTPPSLPGLPALTCMGTLPKVWETFELNQLKSAPSQVLPIFFQDLTGCKLVAINLDRPISFLFYFYFK
jgi:hypothetical protein